jgi:hypothetical protein
MKSLPSELIELYLVELLINYELHLNPKKIHLMKIRNFSILETKNFL